MGLIDMLRRVAWALLVVPWVIACAVVVGVLTAASVVRWLFTGRTLQTRIETAAGAVLWIWLLLPGPPDD